MEEVLGESTPTVFGEASILDLLKQDYQEVQEVEDIYIPLVGWERTGLASKYVLPDSGKDLDLIAQRVMRESKDRYQRNLHICIDTMVLLSEGLFLKPPGIDDYEPLDPEELGMPVTFKDGYRLAPIFGWEGEPPTARVAVLRLFGNQELALLGHAEKLQRWMQNTKADLDVEFWQMGEV
jgi:hypothetical protein